MLNIFNRLFIFLFYSIIILKSPIVWSSDLEKIKKIDSVISLNKIILLDYNKNPVDFIDKETDFYILNFWASWCAPCRAEHKYLMNLKRNAKNLKLIGINFKDEKKNANKFLSEFGDPYHYSAADSEGKVSINFGVYGIPESILVNNDLKIIKKFIGPLNQDEYTSILNLTN